MFQKEGGGWSFHIVSYLQVVNNCMCLLVIKIFALVHDTIQSSVYAFGCTSFVLMFINMCTILIWKLLVECVQSIFGWDKYYVLLPYFLSTSH
jgi:hypothetical protein